MNKTSLTLFFMLALIVCGITFVAYFSFSGKSEEAPAEDNATTTTPGRNKEDLISSKEVIGASPEGRDITAYTYGGGEKEILFVGAIHGGYEWNTVLLSYKLMEYLDIHEKALPENLSVTVIPVLNPDGVVKVMGKTEGFSVKDAPSQTRTAKGRFNAAGVDLNRNFNCNWQSESMWRGETVDAGKAPFSEPEALALRDFVNRRKPVAALFFHSASGAVYGSSCNNGILPETRKIMNVYATASGYPAVPSFDAYPITGDAEGWLAKIGIPSVSVELTSHENVEWQKNKRAVEALLKFYEE